MNVALMWDSVPALLGGAVLTVQLVALALVIGFTLAVGIVLREAYWAAIIALALNTAAYPAELMRGGIEAVPKGQVEAALACGMGPVTRYRRIIMPDAFRQILPAYGNEIILMVKASSLASTITLMEITGIAERIISRTFSPTEVFIVAGAIYLAINFAVTLVIERLEARYNEGLRLAGAAR